MNLLLEGPDLKALLMQAAQTGGASTRIVRAQKVRRGGVYGFFARELFEVTIEVPDPVPAGVPIAAPAPVPAPAPAPAPVPVPVTAGARIPGASSARVLAASARYFDLQPETGPISVSEVANPPIVPAFSTPESTVQAVLPAVTPNRLNDSALHADQSGVSEPYEPRENSRVHDAQDAHDSGHQLDPDLQDLGAELADALPGGPGDLPVDDLDDLPVDDLDDLPVDDLDDLDGLDDADLGNVYRLDGAESLDDLGIEFASYGDDFSNEYRDEYGSLTADDGGYGDLESDDFTGEVTFHMDPAFADVPTPPGLAVSIEPIAEDEPEHIALSDESQVLDEPLNPPAPADVDQSPSYAFDPDPFRPATQGEARDAELPTSGSHFVIPPVEIPGIRIPTGFENIEKLTAPASLTPPGGYHIPQPHRQADSQLPDSFTAADSAADSSAEPKTAEPQTAESETAQAPMASGVPMLAAPESPDPQAESVYHEAAGTADATDATDAVSGRPQFTAMLDQLREGYRPGKHRLDGPRHTPDHPVVAETTGLLGNSALFAVPVDDAVPADDAAPVDDAVAAAMTHTDEEPASVTLETDQSISTMTEPYTGSDNQPAGDAGLAPEGRDMTTHNGFGDSMVAEAAPAPEYGSSHTTVIETSTEAGETTPEESLERGGAALAHARATTVVPSKGRKTRGGGKGRGVPAQRPSPEGEPDLSGGDPEDLAYTVAPQDDPAPSAADVPAETPLGSEYPSSDADDDASAELLGQPAPGHDAPQVPSGSGAWRMLKALTGRRRRRSPEDEELWTPEPASDDHDSWPSAEPIEPVESVESVEFGSHGGAFGSVPVSQLPPADFGTSFGSAPAAHTTFTPNPVTPVTPVALDPATPATPANGLRAVLAGQRTVDSQDQLALDRESLRTLGIPAAWTRHLQSGDRFTAVVHLLSQLPELTIDEDVNVIAVVGPSDVVELETHRTALDLPADGRPRAVASIPDASAGAQRRAAIAASKRTRPIAVAVAVDGYDDPADVRATLAQIKADSVIAVIDASRPLAEITRWIESLEHVDAITLEGALDGARPAEVLSLGVPVIRVDGIAVDQIGWAALLCAQMAALDAQRA